MKFYNKKHKYYCGIDLHTKKGSSASWMPGATSVFTRGMPGCRVYTIDLMLF